MDYPYQHGGSENGGTSRFFKGLERNEMQKWDWTPDFMWECRVAHTDLVGASATETTAITIPAAGFVSGRVTVTFTHALISGGSASVVADAAVGDANTDLATALEAAIATARAGDLAGVVADETVATNVVTVVMVEGIGHVDVTVAWRSAQQIDVTLAGTLIDADYSLTFTGGGLGVPIVVTTTRSGGSPAAITDMIIQVEADVEAAGGLVGVLVSADDDAADGNLLIFEPDVSDVTVTPAIDPNSIALQFGGSPTDGTYSTTFSHSSLPGGSAEVQTIRTASVPVDNAALAVQHEADIEADVRLPSLIASADDDATDTCIVITQPGVTGLTAVTSAPSPGTLTQTPLTWTEADATPAGPTITVAYSTAVNLDTLGASVRGGFPAHVHRSTVALEVITAFGAGRTITAGDAGDPDGLLGSTPITVNTTGRTLHIAADAEHTPRYESGLVPTVTFALGASATLTAGLLYLQIDFSPHPSMTSTAA